MPSFNYEPGAFSGGYGSPQAAQVIGPPQWDGAKPYYPMSDGSKLYVPPMDAINSGDPKLVAWGQQNARPTGSMFSTPGTWDAKTGQWQQDFNGTSLGNLIAGGFLTAGAANALMAPVATAPTAGPAASLAGSDASLLPSTAIGTGMTGPIAGGVGADLSGAALPSTTIGTGMMGPITGSAPSGAMNAALSASGSASPLLKALAGIGGLAGGAIGGHIGSANAVPQQLTDLLDLMSKRTQAQNPLFNAVNSGLYQMLPSYAKTGGPPTAV